MNTNLLTKLFSKQNNIDPGFNLPGGPVGNNKRVVVTLSVALIVVAGLAGYFGYQMRTAKQDAMVNADSQKLESEAGKVVQKVGQLMVLPTDEEPTVATVTDLDALRGQPFFVGAKIGDKVLIYTLAKKAVLYDPVAHKIVNVAPINLGNQVSIPSPESSQ